MIIPTLYSEAQANLEGACVLGFFSRYQFFSISNICEEPIIHREMEFPTIEHAWLADRFLSNDVRQRIQRQRTPGKARRIAEQYELDNPYYDPLRSLTIILDKFYRERLFAATMLRSTQDKSLYNANWWGDDMLGCNVTIDPDDDTGYVITGENQLGIILEQIRETI